MPTQNAGPCVSWVGPEDSRAHLEPLDRVAQVRWGWDPQALLVLVWAPLGPAILHRLPRAAQGVPVLAVCPDPPTPHERAVWVEAGVEDLVRLSAVPRAVTAWLRALGWHSEVQSFSPDSVGAGSPATVPSAPSRSAPPTSSATSSRSSDPFPAVRLDTDDTGFLDASREWTEALQRYLAQRHTFIHKYGRHSLPDFLELSHLRDMVAGGLPGAARPGLFGQTGSGSPPPLDWPIAVRRAGSKDMLMSRCRVVSAGSDGLLIDVGFRSLPRQKLVCDLPVSPDTNAQLMVEARLQRRVGVDRWHMGAMVLEMRLRSLEG